MVLNFFRNDRLRDRKGVLPCAPKKIYHRSRAPIFPHKVSVCRLLTALLVCSSLVSAAQPNPSKANTRPYGLDRPHHPDRLIVKFKPGVDEALKEVVHAKADTKLHKKFKKLPEIEVRQIRGRKSLEEALAAYAGSGVVEYVEPDYEVTASVVPNDPLYAQGYLWQLDNTGQSGGAVDADIDASEAWDVQTASPTIVAIIDSGVRYTHEDLAANMWRN